MMQLIKKEKKPAPTPVPEETEPKVRRVGGDAAQALARGAKTRKLLWMALCTSLTFNLVFPLWDRWMDAKKIAFTILDLASGSLVISPLVEPTSSKELIETMASWAARALLDRSPAGFDDELTLRIVFLKQAHEKAEKEWNAVKDQFVQKSLRQHVEISLIQAQAMGQGIILVHVEGQLIITGVVNGDAIQEAQPVSINFKMARNPDLGRNKRYPLAVVEYTYLEKDANSSDVKSEK